MNDKDKPLLDSEMQNWLRQEPARESARRQMAELGAEFFGEPKQTSLPAAAAAPETPALRVSWVRQNWLAMAAGLLAIVSAVWFLNRPVPDLYAQYAHHRTLSLTERSVSQAAVFTEAETAFEQKDYARALAALTQIVENQPNDLNAQLYRGICLLELGRPAEARTVLGPLADGASAFRGEAVWYLGLSYLLEKNEAGCRAALGRLVPGEERFGQARALLEMLGK